MRRLAKDLLVSIFRHVLVDDRLTALALSGRLVRNFVGSEAGRDYGVGRAQRERLVTAFKRINERIPSATQWPKYIVMAEKLLSAPATLKGDVIECGCYQGASTAALSLLCSMVGRKLIVCDSFAGLPADSADAKHLYPHLGVSTSYEEGDFAASLNQVRANIAACGELSVCEFVPGFFSQSLVGFARPLVFGFLDVDLRSSMEDCVRSLWPCLVDGGVVFTDDSCDMEVVKLWFDRDFWRSELGCDPPGYIGSGCGMPGISPSYSSLGYTMKGARRYEHVSFAS